MFLSSLNCPEIMDCEGNDVLNIKGDINGNVSDVYFVSPFGGNVK